MGSQRVRHDQSDPVCIDARLFFVCGTSAPVRVERKGGAAAWLEGTLAVPSVQRQTASTAGVTALSEPFFQASCSW